MAKRKFPPIKEFKIHEDDSDFSNKKIIIFGLGVDNKMYTWNGYRRSWDLYGEEKISE